MEDIIINKKNMSEEPDKKSFKSRVILTNSKGEILVANYWGLYLFPGGKIDEGETPDLAISREVKEELGIDVKECNIKPFVKTKFFQKDYITKDGNITDRLLETHYYIGNAEATSEKTTLTESEQKGGFSTKFYSIDELEKAIEENPTESPRKEFFNEEMKVILDYYKKGK